MVSGTRTRPKRERRTQREPSQMREIAGAGVVAAGPAGAGGVAAGGCVVMLTGAA